MATVCLAAAAGFFPRDLAACRARVATMITHAREEEADLLVLPHAALGGYLTSLRAIEADTLPPALPADSPVLTEIAALAGAMVVCLGYTETDGAAIYDAAVALSGDGVLGRHRKVHLPPGEARFYRAGTELAAFDTPLGRVGMLIDYDKTFPEAARSLAADGAGVLAFLSAWPASVTRRASSIVHDRQTRLFDLYDAVRAAENQVVVVSANQTGNLGELRFIGHSKIVNPAGEIVARGGVKAGLVVARLDLAAELARARRVQFHLRERRPDVYRDGPRHRDQ
jgi:predicted amidohydrolase